MTTPVPELFDVSGLVVVITGGGTGIGKMYAAALENNGATVYITGRRLEVLEKTAKEISKHGKIFPVKCDISDNDDITALVSKIEAELGFINILINNAGVINNILPSPLPKDLKERQAVLWNTTNAGDFDKTFQINVRSQYFVSVAFMQLLAAGNAKTAERGLTSQVITVASIGGLRRDDESLNISYSTSKAAAIHLGKLLTNFFRDYQIRSNVICPGVFPSEMTLALLSSEKAAKICPLGRPGTVDDMAGLILYMASKAGAYLNGSVHVVDGGRLSDFPSTW